MTGTTLAGLQHDCLCCVQSIYNGLCALLSSKYRATGSAQTMRRGAAHTVGWPRAVSPRDCTASLPLAFRRLHESHPHMYQCLRITE